VVKDGVTGHLVQHVTQLPRAIAAASAISPLNCRRHAEENFSVERMADGYERLYSRVLRRRATAERLAA
jgi:hypothetical protein